MNIENESTFRKSLSDGINLFVGSGFSVLSNDAEGNSLPTASILRQELIDKFQLSDVGNLNLAQICTILEHKQRVPFYDFIKRRFSVVKFDARYRYLERLNLATIITTNVDNLLYILFELSNVYYLNDLDIKGAVFGDRQAIDMITLHGSILDDNRPLRFGTLDLATAFRSDEDRWYFLTQKLQRYPTLFWGYGLSDSGALEAISPQTIHRREQKEKWIVVTEEVDSGTIEYFRALGFFIIEGDTSGMLEYLSGVPVPGLSMVPRKPSVTTKKLFPTETIPDISEVPVRPITDFYLGGSPSWQDIFVGRLHRTNHYAKVVESINARNHTLITGLSASGKTTLLMQVAQGISFSGHKLIMGDVTIEKARLIINKLAGDNALIFIDNLADNIEVMGLLCGQPNIIVVGAERAYYFDIVSHRIKRLPCNIIDVTELDEADIQEILSRIPEGIKSPYYKAPTVAAGIKPSLFELIEANITYPRLKTRYKSVLEQLERQDPNLQDFLISCCYVHSCRTPVSMDMLLALFRGIVGQYADIYRMRDTLGSMISEYFGYLATEEQDYWVPRSNILAEAVISQVSPRILRRVLVRFIEQVSSYRIPRYDIFKRRAYDANLVKKAFPNWKDGKWFYELAFLKDKSPSLLQQGALYLAYKKKFNESFAWIDEAIIKSEGKNPAIRNSHAIILFRANIGRDTTDPVVQRTLQRSMDILYQCYEEDYRKTYHSIAFAKNAVQYWGVFGDSLGKEYLLTSHKWLREDSRSSPWNLDIRRQLELVNRTLSN